MAEVLPPILSQPDHSTRLPGRSSSGEAYTSGQTHHNSQSQQTHSQTGHRLQNQHTHQHSQQYSRSLQMSRNQHNHVTGYRGASAAAPVPQYAFKATPQLRSDSRSPPAQPLSSDSNSAANRQRISSFTSVPSTGASTLSKGEPAANNSFNLPAFANRPYSQAHLPPPTSVSDSPNGNKTMPERYGGNHGRTDSASPVIASKSSLSSTGSQDGKILQNGTATRSFTLPELQIGGEFSMSGQPESKTVADPALPAAEKPVATSATNSNTPRRYRRMGSTGSVDSVNQPGTAQSGQTNLQVVPAPKEAAQTNSAQERPDARPSSSAGSSNHRPSSSSGKNEYTASSVRTPTSADTIRRTNNPSPLSRPMSGDSSNSQTDTNNLPLTSNQNSAIAHSPAVAAMAALNMGDKDANKSVKSRLRRAFSFGSAAELKRATNETETAEDRARARKEQFSSELDEEQSAIAAQQEAAGLGNSIYSGQGNFFTGSTDNLSISSTASSASMMLRKMGRGMKKGGRSLKGLFRPKSVIGVPPPDEPVQPSVGPISMVTVEAERQQVNVNVDPHDQAGGGTNFPRLERNSLDVNQSGIGDGAKIGSRKSILGGEHERAEVLAAVKKGILKRTNTDSPNGSPAIRPADEQLDHVNPPFSSPALERRGSPSPSTTSSEPRRTGHRRTDSCTLEGDDYFANVPRLPGNQSSRSLPGTPRGISRNISFSPRIQFYDVWSSSEYDRRGEIATCNRLTPMLAQQIKEELNNFKMEMEVHEASKPHTHFF